MPRSSTSSRRTRERLNQERSDFLAFDAAGTSTPRLNANRLLVAAQVAISVPLLVGATLFLRSVYNLGRIPRPPLGRVTDGVYPGNETEHLQRVVIGHSSDVVQNHVNPVNSLHGARQTRVATGHLVGFSDF